jgi:hypothetical protein
MVGAASASLRPAWHPADNLNQVGPAANCATLGIHAGLIVLRVGLFGWLGAPSVMCKDQLVDASLGM